jgi:hypothetical protein
MDRITRHWTAYLIILISGLFVSLKTLEAGVVLAPQPSTPNGKESLGTETFPESHFGTSFDQTQPSNFRHTTAEELNEYQERSARRPAGLEFTKDTGQVRPNVVVEDTSMPRSPANLNPKPNSTSRTGVQEVALIAGDLGFFPKTIFVTRDIPVRMFVTGASKKPLCIMMDSFQVRKQIRSQRVEEISFTPSTSGQYRFYCPVNGMEGTLLVKEPSTIANVLEDDQSPASDLAKPSVSLPNVKTIQPQLNTQARGEK